MEYKDPLYYPKLLMIVTGFENNRSLNARIRSAVLTCFYVNGLIVGMFCHSYISFEQLRDHNNSEPAVYACVVFHIAVKYLIWHLRHGKIRALMNKIDQNYRSIIKNTDHNEIMEKAMMKCYKFSKVFVICIIIVYLNHINVLVNHMLDPENNFEMPYLSYVPFDTHKYYYWAVTFQYIICGSPFPLACMQYTSLLSFTILISAEMDVLVEYFQSLKTIFSDNKKDARKKLIKGIERYRNIISFVGEMNAIFTGVMTVEILTSTLQCCLSAYLLAKIPINDPHFLIHMSTFLVTVSLPFFHCWCGQKIVNSSSRILEGVYDCGWEQAPISDRKSVLVCMTMAGKHLSLNWKLFIYMDMERYSVLIQGAYSFFNLIRNVNS